MWNIFSRIFLFTYDMLFRVSRRFLLLWTNSRKRLLGTMEEDTNNSTKKLIPDCGESSGINPQRKYGSQSPVLKQVVIDIEREESPVKETSLVKVATSSFESVDEERHSIEIEDSVSSSSGGVGVNNKARSSVFFDEGASPKKPRLEETRIAASFVVQKSDAKGNDEKKKDKRKKKKKSDDKKLVTDGYKPDLRPNYFVAIQVSNEMVKSKVQEIQEAMMKTVITSDALKSKAKTGAVFKDTLVPVAKLHFTLHVFHLPDKDQVLKAKEIMTKVHSQMKKELESNPMSLTIEGLGHFRNSVLFAKIKEPHHITRLEELSQTLRDSFESAEIMGDTKVFQPHMTIAKMSRSKKLHKMKVRSFPTELWTDYEYELLGSQPVEALQLLSMTESDPVTGYYRCVAQLPFS